MTTLGIIVALCLLVAALTASTTVLRSVSRAWLRHWAEQQLSGAGGGAVGVERPQRLVLSAGTAVAGTVFAMGALVGLREEGLAQLEFLFAAAVLLLIGGQLLPRAVARRWPTKVGAMLLPPLRAAEWLFTPLLLFAERLARRLPAAKTGALQAPGGRESVNDLLREAEAEGLGMTSDRAIIAGVLDFGELRARDVMTLRDDIVGVDRTAAPADVARVVARSQYSRVLVFDGDRDHIAGVVHSFDVLAHPDEPLTSLRPVLAARPDTACDVLMRRLLREHAHLAVIQDASGVVLGLVTLDDLVTELVGDIHDEHDEPEAGAT